MDSWMVSGEHAGKVRASVHTEELRVNGDPGLSSHDSSWKATCGNFELPGFPLAASGEGSAVVTEFLVPGTLPQWADMERQKASSR